MTKQSQTPDWPVTARQWQGERRYQEDAFATQEIESDIGGEPPALLMVLADGMGGEAGGAIASQTVVDTFLDRFSVSSGAAGDRLLDSLEETTERLRVRIEADPGLGGMGSTVVAVLYDGTGVSWLSVGDSPMWLFVEGHLTRLNADHSMVPVLDRLVENGELSPEQARVDSRRNMLRSAVTGSAPELIDCAHRSGRLEPGSYLLIASDGLETLTDEEIGRHLRNASDVDAAADHLFSAVRAAAAPGQDNVTYLLLSGDPGPATRHVLPPESTMAVVDEAHDPVTTRLGPHWASGPFWRRFSLGLAAGIALAVLGLWAARDVLPLWNGEALLKRCDSHVEANGLTADTVGTIDACYRVVLWLDPENAGALKGLDQVILKRLEWAKQALDKKEVATARRQVEHLRLLRPEEPEIANLEKDIGRLERGPAEREVKRLKEEANKKVRQLREEAGREKNLRKKAEQRTQQVEDENAKLRKENAELENKLGEEKKKNPASPSGSTKKPTVPPPHSNPDGTQSVR